MQKVTKGRKVARYGNFVSRSLQAMPRAYLVRSRNSLLLWSGGWLA
jgi:hypothetical protein